MTKEQFRNIALITSGLIGFSVSTSFAWFIYKNQLPQNIATWSMVLILDVLGLVLAYNAGNRRPILQIGWCFAAVCILAAIFASKNLWHWGLIETVSLACCLIAIGLWQTVGAKFGLWPYMAAGYISFIPQAVDYWYKPQPETLWVWVLSVVSCVLAMLGAEKRNFASMFVPGGYAILNLLVCFLIIR